MSFNSESKPEAGNSTQMALVSVIIVTWNCRSIIQRCLELIQASKMPWSYEVIIFDNASSDGTIDIIKRYEEFRLIFSASNLGFGKANNLAAEVACGKYIVFLNPDAFLEDAHALYNLVEALECHPDFDAVGPRLNNIDGSHQVGDAGYAPTLLHVASHQLLVSRLCRAFRGFYVNNPKDLRRPSLNVQWLAATCLVMRRSTFLSVGGFDPSIFMYGEDVLLGCQLTAAGAKFVYLPRVHVVHLQGATQKAGNQLYVSTKWIDSLLAASPNLSYKRKIIKVLKVGFAIRWVTYGLYGKLTSSRSASEKADAMKKYFVYMNRLQWM